MKIPTVAKITLLFLLFSVIPTIGVIALSLNAETQRAQLEQESRLADTSRQIEFQLKGDLERFREVLLTSARNPAMINIIGDPAHLQQWKQEVNESLRHLTTMFPGVIDEACRINPNGAELGRVVQGKIATPAELSPDETRNPFFKPTVALNQGQVWYQTAYISPDTNRWVISVSTPLYSQDQNYGILHFEVVSL